MPLPPVPTDDFETDKPGRPAWQALRNLALGVLLASAVALIAGFLGATAAHAQVRTGEPRAIEASDTVVVAKP